MQNSILTSSAAKRASRQLRTDDAQAPRRIPPIRQTAQVAPSGETYSLRALLADDNELFRLFLRRILSRHFPAMAIAEARSGDDALMQGAEFHPHLVFMDLKLPDRSGLDLTRQFKSADPGVLIYLVTQHDTPEYRAAARECGADQLIVLGESSEGAIVALVEANLFGAQAQVAQTTTREENRSSEKCLPSIPG